MLSHGEGMDPTVQSVIGEEGNDRKKCVQSLVQKRW